MTRIESELHDLYECLMRNDDMADRDTYHTIVGIANDVAEVEAENAKLRELVKALDWCTEHFDLPNRCDKCPLEQSDKLPPECEVRMHELGIEVDGR